MAKLRLKKRRNLPKKKAFAARKPSYTDSSSYDSRSESHGSYTESSRSRSGSSSPGSSSEEDSRDYKKGGYHPVEIFQLYARRYRVLGKLGSGAFSTVWLCADEKAKNQELVAMKVCKSSRTVCEQTLDEIKLLDSLESEYTATLMAHFWHSGPNGNHKCLIFELMGENLLAMVRHFNDIGLPMRWVKKIAYDTLRGLAHIHSRQIIHTDLKLENVLITRHDRVELLEEVAEITEILRKREAILAKRVVPVDTSNMTKSQKRRLKKKQKKKATAQEEDKVEEEAADPEEEDEELPPLPTPPSRQKYRLDNLKLRDLQCKLTDFGNGCWFEKHFTDEIQTRQYRAPEAILGQTYDASTDLWSAACMFFELLTGDFLFAPKSSRRWQRDEDHIALIIELLGTYPPVHWALEGRYAKTMLTNDAKPKKIKKLKFWSLHDVLVQKYKLDPDEAQDFCDFLLPMLAWKPEDRVTAEEALNHPWLNDAHNNDAELDVCAAEYIEQRECSDSGTELEDDDSDEGEYDDENDDEHFEDARPSTDVMEPTDAESSGSAPQCLSPSHMKVADEDPEDV